MSAAELAEWKAFYTRVEPWGDVRGDWQAGKIAAAVMNAAGWTARDGRQLEAKDYLLQFEPRPEPKAQDWRTMKAILEGWADRHNARLAKGGMRAGKRG